MSAPTKPVGPANHGVLEGEQPSRSPEAKLDAFLRRTPSESWHTVFDQAYFGGGGYALCEFIRDGKLLSAVGSGAAIFALWLAVGLTRRAAHHWYNRREAHRIIAAFANVNAAAAKAAKAVQP